MTTISLAGWDIERADDAAWVPWGQTGDARAKILGNADGYLVMYVEAEPGYRGDPHEHTNAEFFYLIEGRVRNQGQPMQQGDGYAAAAGSTHTDFEAETAARYIVIFKV
jgi:quercetin dioxygenase-like cupin family protein